MTTDHARASDPHDPGDPLDQPPVPQTSAPPVDTPHRTATLRNPEDLLAAVTVVFGFDPSDCIAMLTFGGAHCFHARVDLGRPDHLPDVVESLLEPARRHRVASVALVVYTGDERVGRRTGAMLRRRFRQAGIGLITVLRADGERWWVAAGPRHGVPDHGVAYRVDTHPIRVQSVVDGEVTHESRAALAATLQPDPAGVDAVAALVGLLPHDAGLAPDVLVRWCAAHVETDTVFTDAELATVAMALRALPVRDAAWAPMTRASARCHVRLWSDALTRTPPGLVGGVAGVLAFAAWLSGRGALAWCAVDRSLDDDPDNSLGRLVGDLLADAVPPAAWTAEVMAEIAAGAMPHAASS